MAPIYTQTDPATASVVVLPVEDYPRQWNPPPVMPGSSRRGSDNAKAIENTKREFPLARSAIFYCHPSIRPPTS